MIVADGGSAKDAGLDGNVIRTTKLEGVATKISRRPIPFTNPAMRGLLLYSRPGRAFRTCGRFGRHPVIDRRSVEPMVDAHLKRARLFGHLA